MQALAGILSARPGNAINSGGSSCALPSPTAVPSLGGGTGASEATFSAATGDGVSGLALVFATLAAALW